MIFSYICNTKGKYAEKIKTLLSNPTKEMLMLIADYNPALLKGDKPYENWLKICLSYAKKANIPLLEWFEKKPTFTFSQKKEE